MYECLSARVGVELQDNSSKYSISTSRLHSLTGEFRDNIIFLRSILTSTRKSDNRDHNSGRDAQILQNILFIESRLKHILRR